MSEFNDLDLPFKDSKYFKAIDPFLKSQSYEKPEPEEDFVSIRVFTENEFIDGVFWKKLFKNYHPKYRFKITPHKYKGCDGLIENLAKPNKLGACKVICIDSDYRYLHDEDILKNKFVFHTYAHSVENHFCYSGNLQYYCDNISTLNCDEDYDFDFNAFLSEYSEIIYNNYLCALCKYYKNHDLSMLENTKQKQYLSFKDVIPKLNEEYKKNIELIQKIYKSPYDQCKHIQIYVIDFVSSLKERIIFEFKKDYKTIQGCKKCNHSDRKYIKKHILGAKGVTKNNLYLFVRGHTLYDNGIQQLIAFIIKLLKKIKECEIEDNSQHKSTFHNHCRRFEPHGDIIPQGINVENRFIKHIKIDIQKFIDDSENQVEWFGKAAS